MEYAASRNAGGRFWQGFAATSAIVALIATGCAKQTQAQSGVTGADTPISATEILQRLNSGGVVSSIGMEGDTVLVSGSPHGADPDGTRTIWYETVAGAAYAQGTPAKWLSRTVFDEKGAVIENDRDAVMNGGVDAFGPITLDEAGFVKEISSRAATLGVRVVSTTYIALFGGSGEIVIQPTDGRTFVADAAPQIGTLLGELGKSHPYLVTVVDDQQSPLLIVGFTPNVGGDNGQGLAWLAPGLESSAVWGSGTVNPG